jgi:hypothetical protein
MATTTDDEASADVRRPQEIDDTLHRVRISRLRDLRPLALEEVEAPAAVHQEVDLALALAKEEQAVELTAQLERAAERAVRRGLEDSAAER